MATIANECSTVSIHIDAHVAALLEELELVIDRAVSPAQVRVEGGDCGLEADDPGALVLHDVTPELRLLVRAHVDEDTDLSLVFPQIKIIMHYGLYVIHTYVYMYVYMYVYICNHM